MPELASEADAHAYLAEVFPSQKFALYAFDGGWVCTPELSQQDIDAGRGLGLARHVIDTDSGTIYLYPSWAAPMVAEAHSEFKRTGQNSSAQQVYPHQWRITLQKSGETGDAVEYQMTVESLTDPPDRIDPRTLTLDKAGHGYQPTDSMSARASAHVRWARERNEDTWPATDEFTF